MSIETGLRERKKAATRQALYEAAVRLAMEHGPERITVEAIADEAGVSRRTFSNYFANKEEALFHGDRARTGLLIEKVRARPAGEAPWAALSAAAIEFYGQLGDLNPEWISQTRLLRRHPSLAAAQAQTFATMEHELGEEVAARMDQDPSEVRAKLIAATFLATLRVSLTVWLEHPADASYLDVARRALAETGRGFA
ncbi:TetR family transcriptional regulator [Actinoplanes sp. NPDC051861]|uniref:TetR/AcrR family transcriptional regulator n=1 Tax=Actinoplanes sp. NPDC051861 TaxID=3155170 RepID=UPI003431C925